MKFLETLARKRRMKKHQRNFTNLIKRIEEDSTPDKPYYPWVRLETARCRYPGLDQLLTDVSEDYKHNEWKYTGDIKWLRKDNDILTFIETYAPELTYSHDPLFGVSVTTRIVTKNQFEKQLDIAFDGYHLEIADASRNVTYDLRHSITLSDIDDLCLKYNLRVVDDETGVYTTVPRTEAYFRVDAPYDLWSGIPNHAIKVTEVNLRVSELVTYTTLPKVSPDDTVHRSKQVIVTSATAYLNVEFEKNELERARKGYEIATNLLEECESCKNN